MQSTCWSSPLTTSGILSVLFVSQQLFVYKLLFCVKETGIYLLTAAFFFFPVLQVYAALINFIQNQVK